jgi:uncharacterized protein (DUF433 family)
MNAHMPPSVFGIGLYPLPEAARLAQLDTRTARRWAEGYDYRYRGGTRRSPGVMGLAFEVVGGQRDLTFLEMLTLRLVKGFRGAGLSLRTIKRVAQVAAEEFDLPNPLVTRKFRTDGRKVLLEVVDMQPANDGPALPPRERKLIDILSRQQEFADIVEPSLFQNVDWDQDLASRWWPLGLNRAVVLDPGLLFGAPHISGTRVPSAVIASAVHAEGGGEQAIRAVAEWHGITPRQVRDAMEFETAWLGRAA